MGLRGGSEPLLPAVLSVQICFLAYGTRESKINYLASSNSWRASCKCANMIEGQPLLLHSEMYDSPQSLLSFYWIKVFRSHFPGKGEQGLVAAGGDVDWPGMRTGCPGWESPHPWRCSDLQGCGTDGCGQWAQWVSGGYQRAFPA